MVSAASVLPGARLAPCRVAAGSSAGCPAPSLRRRPLRNGRCYFLVPPRSRLVPKAPPVRRPSVCSLSLRVCFRFICSFIYLLIVRFHVCVKSHGICHFLSGLFRSAYKRPSRPIPVVGDGDLSSSFPGGAYPPPPLPQASVHGMRAAPVHWLLRAAPQRTWGCVDLFK